MELPGPEFYYYKISRNGQRLFYLKTNDKRIARKDIPPEFIDQIQTDFYSTHIDRNNLQNKLDEVQERLDSLLFLMRQHQISIEDRARYQQNYEANQTRSHQIPDGPDRYYYKVTTKQRRCHSYQTGKIFSKARLPNEWHNQIQIDYYPLICEYDKLQAEIKDLTERFAPLNELLAGSEQSFAELEEERTLLLSNLPSSLRPPFPDPYSAPRRDYGDLLSELVLAQMILNAQPDPSGSGYLVIEPSTIPPPIDHQPLTQPATQRRNTIPPGQLCTREDESTEVKEIQCKICMVHKKAVSIECGHCFCAQCYNSLLSSRKCPFCREPLAGARIVYYD